MRPGTVSLCLLVAALLGGAASAQGTPPATQTASPAETQTTGQSRISCASQPGERQHCTADTSAGVALVNVSGAAPCLLGKTWGYDDTGIWVSDGCSGEFVAGQTTQRAEKKKPLEYVPNAGFLLYDGEKGQIYFRLFSYARYLNQLNIDPSYVDAFGVTQPVKQRQDIQLAKLF